jgi:hypothetical protein
MPESKATTLTQLLQGRDVRTDRNRIIRTSLWRFRPPPGGHIDLAPNRGRAEYHG